MLCDVILPFLFVTICQTDETLAGYAEPALSYDLIELRGQVPGFRAALRLPARKSFELESGCARLTARLTAPLPWFALEDVAAETRPCDGPEPDLAKLLKGVTLAEIAGDVILLSGEAGALLVFRAQD